MDTGFLNNTANVLIVSITIILILVIIVWVSMHKNVQVTREGIKIIDPFPYDTFANQIPGIDEWLKNKLRAVMLDNVDSLFGMMVGIDPVTRQTLLLAVLDEVSQRISINGFAKILSNVKLRTAWVMDRKKAIISKVCAHSDGIDRENIERILDNILAFIQHEFANRTLMACEKKIMVYEKYIKQSRRVKYLLNKNTNYIKELKDL